MPHDFSQPSVETDPPLFCERLGTGRRIVLVHGFTQTGRSWHRLAVSLSQQHEVVTVDLPGHGNSASSHAKDLTDAAWLGGKSAGRAPFVGYSLGGRVCLHLGLHHPELVERLVLISATPGIRDATERAERRARDEALAEQLDPKAGVGKGLVLVDFLNDW